MALILARKFGEKVVIGNDVVIQVIGIGPGFVRLGIDAPPEVSIDREEVRAEKLRRAALEFAPADVETVADAGNVGNTHELSEAFDLADVMDRR
jgi:carbon storage regulator